MVAFITASLILATSPSDSGQRGFGHGAVGAVCWLYLLWLGVAVVAVARNREVPKYFWLVFITNVVISLLILAQLWLL